MGYYVRAFLVEINEGWKKRPLLECGEADMLTKTGLIKIFRQIMNSGKTRLQELTAQVSKRMRLDQMEEKVREMADSDVKQTTTLCSSEHEGTK